MLLNLDAGEHDDEPEALWDLADILAVACGGHAGDTNSMRRLAAFCATRAKGLGAHPSYPDHEGFGRRSMRIEPSALADSIEAQCAALAAAAHEAGTTVRWVKPHGALYHDANRERALADALLDGAVSALGSSRHVLDQVRRAFRDDDADGAARDAGHGDARNSSHARVRNDDANGVASDGAHRDAHGGAKTGPHAGVVGYGALGVSDGSHDEADTHGAAFALIGPPHGCLLDAARDRGIPYLREGFADRGVLPDGTLTPRDQPGALITDPALAAARARELIDEVDTICVHADTPSALAVARAVREALDG